jgi:Cu(I)/Ag(I) efflux system membrane fusion protein/cobalt-zinc-cadmium efflux system membrane fusion protein
MNKRKIILSTILFLLVVLVCFYLFARHFAGERKREVMGPESSVTAVEVIKYVCGMHPFVVKDEPGTCPICGMDLTPTKEGAGLSSSKLSGERKVKYWVAPMDPTYIREGPGKSPMGMDLIPVYEDEAASGAVINIDPVTSQNMGVRTARVIRRDLNRTIRTVGLVNYEESRQYSVNSKIDGWVEKLHVNQNGQHVKKGQPLLNIYSPDLVSAQEEFLLALRNKTALERSGFPDTAERGKRLLEASRRRLKLWDISDWQIRRLEKTGNIQKTMTLYAPYDGIVTLKAVHEGMYAKAGMELFQISDISRVWVYADIYEYELPWVKVGQEAEVILPFVGGKRLLGKISFLYPYVEPRTRTVKARIDLENPELELKPEMFVNVLLNSRTIRDVLTVPAEAVLRSGEKETVFMALEEGKFEPREVKTGLQSEDGAIEIVQGLLEGEKVVTSAQFMLDSESNLREAIQKMLAPHKEPAGPDHAGHDKKGDAAEMEELFEKQPKQDLEDLFK